MLFDMEQLHLYFSDNNCLEVVFFLFPQFSLNFGSHRKNVCTWICKMILICRSILSTNEDTQGIISLHRFQFEIFIDLL
jgi:hypothetical protein